MLIATLLLASSFAVAAPTVQMPVAAAAAVEAAQTEVQLIKKSKKAEPEELGFMDAYFPFSYADDLSPEIEDNKTTAHILMVFTGFCFGTIWVPMLMYGETPDGYVQDAAISWLVHAATGCIPAVGGFIALANCFYLGPVAATNIWDRKAKAQGGKKRAELPLLPPNRQASSSAQELPAMVF